MQTNICGKRAILPVVGPWPDHVNMPAITPRIIDGELRRRATASPMQAMRCWRDEREIVHGASEPKSAEDQIALAGAKIRVALMRRNE